MVTAIEPLLREQLIDRRHKLEIAANGFSMQPELTRLLQEVDAALLLMDQGTYGLCDVCHDPVESERLIANPLTRLCIDHLTSKEQRALEDDLALAARIQSGLLPQPSQKIDGWEIAYHYQPAGIVSGDYCDLIGSDDQSLLFVLGDVSGKGVAASMLMAHLQAMFRTLISINLPLEEIVERASRVFCESTLPTHYATLVCGNANTSGALEICNAGHLPPLLLRDGSVRSIAATGLPVGVFCNEHFSVNRFQMDKGDTLFLYTDGLSEALDGAGSEYGVERLSAFLTENHGLAPKDLISTCVSEVDSFRLRRPITDDVTLMAIKRVH
ncbi:MAG: SpoIIE family protein phosphatase [Pyrinomonadaceae bacterium]